MIGKVKATSKVKKIIAKQKNLLKKEFGLKILGQIHIRRRKIFLDFYIKMFLCPLCVPKPLYR